MGLKRNNHLLVFVIATFAVLVAPVVSETDCFDNNEFAFTFEPSKKRRRSITRKCKWLARLRKENRRKRLCKKLSRVAENCRLTCNYQDCNIAPAPSMTPSSIPSLVPSSPPSMATSVSPSLDTSSTPSVTPSSLPSTTLSIIPSLSPSSLFPSIVPSLEEDLPVLPGKKGTCWTLRDIGKTGSFVGNLPKVRALYPHWMYSWGQKPPNGVPTQPDENGGIEIPYDDNRQDAIDYIPMLWGYYENLFESFTDDIIDQNPKMILGFNEPDSSSQSNISVSKAVEGWTRLVDKVTAKIDDPSKVLMVSPSCVHPMGIWMDTFMDTVTEQGVRVDVIGVHFYGGASTTAFKNKMEDIYEYYGLPLLITEFAVADWEATSVEANRHSEASVLAFLKDILPWMEEQDWILGYNWFSFEKTNRFGTSSALVYEEQLDTGGTVSKLTALGEYYSEFSSTIII